MTNMVLMPATLPLECGKIRKTPRRKTEVSFQRTPGSGAYVLGALSKKIPSAREAQRTGGGSARNHGGNFRQSGAILPETCDRLCSQVDLCSRRGEAARNMHVNLRPGGV